jgi:hypothetical protein
MQFGRNQDRDRGSCSCPPDAGGRRGDAVFEQDLLGEYLGGFEAGTVGLGAVGADVHGGEGVHQSERKRHLGPDDNEADAFVLRERNQAGDIIGGDGETRDLGGDTGVAGRTDDARADGGVNEGANQGVFASAGADDEDGSGEHGGKGERRNRRPEG